MKNDNIKNICRWVLLLLSIIIFLSACYSEFRVDLMEIDSISRPGNLKNGLANTTIYFIKNFNDKSFVHITEVDRTFSQTTELHLEGNRVSLSPQLRYLIYDSSKHVGGELRKGIWLHDLRTGKEKNVIVWPSKLDEVHLSHPSFSPDGEHLIFTVTWFDKDEIGLATIDLDGSNLEILDTDRHNGNTGPRYSPDGEKIVVICGGMDVDSGQPGFQLCIMDKDGSNRELFTRDGDYHGTYRFTPDSQHIIYSESEYGSPFGILLRPRYDIKIKNIEEVNPTTILAWDQPLSILALSEDGGEIVCLESDKDGVPQRILVVNREGTNLRHLAYFDEFLADWYADNKKINH